ncbi:MAG: hypothetical protein AB3N24_15240 [Leisingera sp.]
MRAISLWIGSELPLLTRLALMSWLRHADGADLYVADPDNPPIGVPEGVRLKAAGDILPLGTLDRLKPLVRTRHSPRQERLSYSDIFRIALQRQGLGFWFDTDVILFRRFRPDPERAWFAYDGKGTIGVSALYFPPSDPFVEEFLRVLDHPDLWPFWMGFKRRILKPAMYRALGKSFRATDLGMTVYGNEAMCRILGRQGRRGEAQPMQTMYYLPGASCDFYDPACTAALLENPDIIGLHVHQKRLSAQPPRSGSAFDLTLRDYSLA